MNRKASTKTMMAAVRQRRHSITPNPTKTLARKLDVENMAITPLPQIELFFPASF